MMADISAVPGPTAEGASRKAAVEAAAAAPMPAAGLSADTPAPNTVSGFIYGLQLAHSDFAQWFYKPHGSTYDAQMAANVDANGLRREWFGYGLLALVVLLMCTSVAPLVANLVCIGYPLLITLALLRGSDDAVERTRFLTYWALFAVLSICDYKFGFFAGYWIFKVLLCTYLYLPQTQGAVVVYAGLVRPILDFVDAVIAPKLA